MKEGRVGGGDCKTTKEGDAGGREGERTGRNEVEMEIKECGTTGRKNGRQKRDERM